MGYGKLVLRPHVCMRFTERFGVSATEKLQRRSLLWCMEGASVTEGLALGLQKRLMLWPQVYRKTYIILV